MPCPVSSDLTKTPIRYPEVTIGQPLPFDAYSSNGTLLLRKGVVVASASQAEKLQWQTSYVLSHQEVAPGERSPRARPSPLSLIIAARHRLYALYVGGPSVDFPVKLSRIVDVVVRACQANPDLALASILMHREGLYTIRHAVNVAIVCHILGTAMELTAAELTATVTAALTMNIGMFELQKQLHSKAGPLTDEQREEVLGHCERGVLMLTERGVTDALGLDIVRDHHERPGGDGYPAGKKSDALGVPTQLLSLADVYCARVSSRDYRPAMLANVALRWLFLNEGATFDQRFASMFIKALGVYPPGTGVRLRDGSIAVVTHRGALSHRPKATKIVASDGERVTVSMRGGQTLSNHSVREVVDLDALQLQVAMDALWGPDARIWKKAEPHRDGDG